MPVAPLPFPTAHARPASPDGRIRWTSLAVIWLALAASSGRAVAQVRDGTVTTAASLESIGDPVEQRRALEEAVERNPSDARLHFLLARSLRDHPLIRAGWHGNEWTPATDRARDELTRALQLDPTLEPAVLALAAMALGTPDTVDDVAVLRRLEPLSERRGANPEVFLAMARLAAVRGDVAGAVTAAVHTSGSPVEPVAQYVAATTDLCCGDTKAGLEIYLQLLNGGGPATPFILGDLRELLPRERLQRWRDLSTGVGDSVRAFWETRAALEGVDVRERLAEHFRRIHVSNRDFVRTSVPEIATSEWSVVDREAGRRYDQRGVVYIKYGDPTRRVGGPNEEKQLWIYDLPDGERVVFGLVLPERSLGGYVIAPPASAIPEGLGGEPLALLRQIQLEHEADVKRREGCSGCTTTRELQINSNMRQEMLRALSRNSYVPPFKADIPFSHALYAFRSADGGTDLVFAAAAPLQALSLESTDPWTYSARAIATVYDSASRRSFSVDTAVLLATRTTPPLDATAAFHVTLHMPAAKRAVYRLAVRSGAEGEEHGRIVGGPLPVREFPPNALSMSDVVVANARPGSWTRGAISLALNPSAVLEKDGQLTLFYEVYGLASGAAYRTTIQLAPVGGGVGGAVQRMRGARLPFEVQFDGQVGPSFEGTLQEVRDVRPQLPAGEYLMTVTVREAGRGKGVSAERRIRIVER